MLKTFKAIFILMAFMVMLPAPAMAIPLDNPDKSYVSSFDPDLVPAMVATADAPRAMPAGYRQSVDIDPFNNVIYANPLSSPSFKTVHFDLVGGARSKGCFG